MVIDRLIYFFTIVKIRVKISKVEMFYVRANKRHKIKRC